MNTGELLLRMLTQKEQGGFLFDSEDHLAKHGQCQLIRGHTTASCEFNVIKKKKKTKMVNTFFFAQKFQCNILKTLFSGILFLLY